MTIQEIIMYNPPLDKCYGRFLSVISQLMGQFRIYDFSEEGLECIEDNSEMNYWWFIVVVQRYSGLK